jgi:hypothetical protein
MNTCYLADGSEFEKSESVAIEISLNVGGNG